MKHPTFNRPGLLAKGPQLFGSARIGRNGTKLHPVYFRDGHWQFLCTCTGTSNGHAHKNASFFRGVEPNCKNA
jgi:hypothetical protein